ncbi:MAG: glycosyltransferase family 39 protein, partial [Microthrixaceae bacterium]
MGITEGGAPARLLQAAVGRWATVVIVIGVLVSASAIGVALVSDGSVSFADESDYASLAANLADSGRFSMDGVDSTAFRPPGFPFFLTAAALFSEDLVVLRVSNAALAGCVVVLAALVARLVGGRLAALLAAAGSAVSPIALYTATKLYPQTLAAVLLLGSLGAVLLAVRREGSHRMIWSAVAGLGAGALTLTVPNHGVTVLAMVLWLVWTLRGRALWPVLVLLAVSAVVVGSWTVRNLVVLDEVVPVSTNGGINLLLGNNDRAGAGTGPNVDISEVLEEANRRGLDEVDRDEFLRDEATEWIVSNPVDAGRLYAAKFLNTFSVSQELATDDQQPSTLATVVVAATYLPLLAVFVL